jgi:hypothetical protein
MSRKHKRNKRKKENKMIITSEDKHNLLDVQLEEFGECHWCNKQSDAVLRIPFQVWAEWLHIMHKMDKDEWTAVFDVVDNTLVAYRIPKQEVSSSSCELEEDLGGNGVVHSHHSMGAFHSGQDDKHARNLYQWSIVLSHTDYVITHRTQLPCGGWGHKKCKIELVNTPEIAFENLKEKSYVVKGYTPEDSSKEIRYQPYYEKYCAWCRAPLDVGNWLPVEEATEDAPLCEQCTHYLEQSEELKERADFHYDSLS